MTFEQIIQIGERLGLPALFYLLLFSAGWAVVRWFGKRIDRVGQFAAPEIKKVVGSHVRFLDTTSDELPKTRGAIDGIGNWLSRRWPDPQPKA